MGKMRSKGVSFLGAWLIVSGTVGLVRAFRAGYALSNPAAFMVNTFWLAGIIACGAGLAFLKEWARRLTMAMQCLSAILTAIFVLRMSAEEWGQVLASAGATSAEVSHNALALTVIVISFCWAGLVCFFLTRPKVKDQFAAGKTEAGS